MAKFRSAAAAALVSLAASSVGHAAVRPEVASMRTAPIASMDRAGTTMLDASDARRKGGKAGTAGAGKGASLLIPLLGGLVVAVVIIIAVSGNDSSPR